MKSFNLILVPGMALTAANPAFADARENIAPQAAVFVSSAGELSKGFQPKPWLNRPGTLNDGFLDPDQNFRTATRATPLSPEAPEWFVLEWEAERFVASVEIQYGRGDPKTGPSAIQVFTGNGEPRFSAPDNAAWAVLPPDGARTRAVRILFTDGNAPVGAGEIVVMGTAGAASPRQEEAAPPPNILFTLPAAGKATVQIRDAAGKVVANPAAGVEFGAGANAVEWDLSDFDGKPVLAPGTYTWSGLYNPGLEVVPLFSYFPTPVAGMPWGTEDRAGGWLADHEAPRSIARGDDGKMWLAAFGEAGHSFVETDESMRKLWGIDRVWISNPAEICFENGAVYAWCEGHWLKEGQTIVEIRAKDKANRKIMSQGRPEIRGCTGFQVAGGLAFVSFAEAGVVRVYDISKGLAAPYRDFGWDVVGRQFDEQKPVLVTEIKMPSPGRIRKINDATLALVNATSVVTLDTKTFAVKEAFRHGLKQPLGFAAAQGKGFAIGDNDTHQVVLFNAFGRRAGVLGKPGRREVGAFDPQDLDTPHGLEFDARGRLWVMEHTDFPRRVSVWDTTTGRCVNAVYGPTQYGGGGCVDPGDVRRVFYKGLEFRVGADGAQPLHPVRLFYRPDSAKYGRWPDGDYPAYAFRARGTLWFTSYMHPHNHPGLVLWRYDDSATHARPVAAMGSAVALRLAFGEPLADRKNPADYADTSFLKKHIPGYDESQKFFTWTDLDGDGFAQPAELKFGALQNPASGRVLTHALASWNWRMNKDFAASASVGDGRFVTFKPSGFTPSGLPLYDVPKETLEGSGEAFGVDSEGNTIMLGSPLRSVAPGGEVRWAYRNEWPGLHAGHNTTARGDEPGVLIAPTRVWGVEPVNDALGEVVCFNSNLGAAYLMTARDGLYIDHVFQDQRVGLFWNFPRIPDPATLAKTTLIDEHFGGVFQRAGDGRFYYVVGKTWCTVVELRGLDNITRLPGGTFEVTPGQIAAAQDRRAAAAAKTNPPKIHTIPFAPGGAKQGETIDGFRLSHDRENFYIHFSGKAGLSAFRNKGENPLELFKTGDVIDVMLQTNPNADPRRAGAGEGDIRILISEFKGKPVAVLYDFKVPGFKGEPVAFASPWRSVHCDTVRLVEDAKIEVTRDGDNIAVAASIPLRAIRLNPAALEKTRGDVGRVYGDQTGTAAVRREYWSNKNTAIMSDLPSEAGLQPALWGEFRFTP